VRKNFKFFIFSFFIFGYVFAQDKNKQQNSCVTCHSQIPELQNQVKEFEQSIHYKNKIMCNDCHGGNPEDSDMSAMNASNFIGKPDRQKIPYLCARCHSDPGKMRQYNLRTDQFELYKTSKHGKLLIEKNDNKVATCSDCHNAHDIRKKNDPESSVYHTKVPETCAKCHANSKVMKAYNIPIDQFEKYNKSYHGMILASKIQDKNPLLVPNCATCHGTHGATPPLTTEIPEVCGNCHGNTVDYFKQSLHYEALLKKSKPKCVDCHGTHEIKYPSIAMFSGKEPGHCGSCHNEGTEAYKQADLIKKVLLDTEDSVKQARIAIKEISGKGRNIADLEELMENAETGFVETIPVMHTLSIAKISLNTNKIKESSNAILTSALKFKEELNKRKLKLIVVLLNIIIIIILIGFKLKTLQNKKAT
jgi:predicted CXXCH cytochrome family protein